MFRRESVGKEANQNGYTNDIHNGGPAVPFYKYGLDLEFRFGYEFVLASSADTHGFGNGFE